MLLALTTTHSPASDLGFLLEKHPDRCQSFSLAYGSAHVFYPEVGPERCTAVLLLDVDPVNLVRPKGDAPSLEPYVNDRPYVASSFLAVALAQIYRSAMNGQSRSRPELADTPIPLRAELPVVPARGGERLLRGLFEPLGYTLELERLPLDEAFPAWGASNHWRVSLAGTVRLKDLLCHLYVLLPVLDADKHYWVGEDEVEKLLKRGEGWLQSHPMRDEIARRYLKRQTGLVRQALTRLVEEEAGAEEGPDAPPEREAELEARVGLNQRRLDAVLAVLQEVGARSVVDLGCGEGKLLGKLLADRSFERVAGLEVSHRALEILADRLKLDRLPPAKRERLALLHGSLTYRDKRIQGFDAAISVEVIEHIDQSRLPAFERAVLGFARPGTLILTTPNVEYNARYEGLPQGRLRHRDHRFEWTRAEFRAWAEGAAARYGYAFRWAPVGDEDPELGPPTQMGVFTRLESAGANP